MNTTAGTADAFMAQFDIRRMLRDQGIYIVLIVFIAVAMIAVPQFATVNNGTNILRSVSIIGIVALGMTFVVVSGNLVDLSVPVQVSTASLIVLSVSSHSLLLGIVLALGAVAVIGAINGTLISRGANPVLVTLAVQTILAGVILEIRGASNVYGSPGLLTEFGKAGLGPIPLMAVAFLLAACFCHLVLRNTSFGFQVFAVGANRAAAKVSGVPVRRLVTGVFILSAALAGFAGIVLAGYTNSANLTSGQGYEFDALTAVVVGGSSLFGGYGGIGRTVAGVALIGILENVMILIGLPFEAQYLVKGCLIILAVSFDALLRRRLASR
jgi:ribose transport system permease protein